MGNYVILILILYIKCTHKYRNYIVIIAKKVNTFYTFTFGLNISKLIYLVYTYIHHH